MSGANPPRDEGAERGSLNDVLQAVSLPSAGRGLAPLTWVRCKLALYILAYPVAVSPFHFADYFNDVSSLPRGLLSIRCRRNCIRSFPSILQPGC